MSLEIQIKKLETQQKTLKSRLENLKQKRRQEISSFIEQIDLKDLGSDTFIGLILEALEAPFSQQETERWQRRGKKFCRQQKTRLPRADKKSPATPSA